MWPGGVSDSTRAARLTWRPKTSVGGGSSFATWPMCMPMRMTMVSPSAGQAVGLRGGGLGEHRHDRVADVLDETTGVVALDDAEQDVVVAAAQGVVGLFAVLF